MMPQPSVITAVVVLYQRAPAKSEALVSLQQIFAADLSLAARFSLLLYDNSPLPHSIEGVQADCVYVHDPENAGLATAYNYALDRASQKRSEWLLLLDQDTTLTAEYIHSLLHATLKYESDLTVSSIVPLIEMDGRLYSPEENFFYHVRHQFPRMQYFPVAREARGLQKRPLNAYNSGAAIRVSTLKQIGGFPVDFRVDYLDHAVFHKLYLEGRFMVILPVVLQQKLSHKDLNDVSLERHSSVLQAQSLFMARYGAWLDRVLYRLWLLRRSRDYRAGCSDPRVWKGMVRQALGRWKLPEGSSVR